MVVVKNSIVKNLKVAVGSSAVIGFFFFAFIKDTNHVEYAVLITLVITAIYGAISLIALIDRRKKIIIDDVGILLPGNLKEYLPWEEILSMHISERFGRYHLSIYSTKLKQQCFAFFPLDVDLKNFSEFLNKRIDDMRPRLESAFKEQTEKEFAASLDSQKSVIQSEKPQNNVEGFSADEAEDIDSMALATAIDKKEGTVDDDNDNDDSILPLWFTKFPVINKALFGGFFTSVICFILLLVAQLDNPGPRTMPMGTGLVFVVGSFFLGTVIWAIFDAWRDFRDEFFYGRKPRDPGPLKRQKEKKPVVMQMKKRSRK